jgi:HD domain
MTNPHGASASELADELEERMMEELNVNIVRSVLFQSGDVDPTEIRDNGSAAIDRRPGSTMLIGADPRLKKMPDKPTLMDFFKYRFASLNHVMQSARLALINGYEEKVVFACLLHDIANSGFIRSDHGYWGAQLIAPYVDEEVAWAIRAHQALRFFPDESVGYKYPDQYIRLFGPNYEPEPYIKEAYKRARDHKWYMTSRLICVNDLYSFDPNVVVKLEDFTDIIGRNFRQPEEGLGWDDSPSSHMWRTINWPTRFL